MVSVTQLQKEIRRLASEQDAIILVHNYQIPEIQEIGDYVGDSLGLCMRAQKVEHSVILFCGVDFMAETAAILNPSKKVLIPDPTAKCPLAAQLPADLVRKAKERYPEFPVVLYVNTTAEAKAEADVICTSANLCLVLNRLNQKTVIFGPDGNMADHARYICKQEVISIPDHGFCHVHETFTFDPYIHQLLKEHPEAKLLVHPECDWELQEKADFIGSTSQMIKYARESPSKSFIIATEVDLVSRLRREIPDKSFLPALNYAICRSMKKITLAKVKASLIENQYIVKVPESIANPARGAIQRMFDLTKDNKEK